MNTTAHPGMIETVREKTVAATEGTGHIVEKVVDTTAKVITTTAKNTAEVGGAIATAATGLVKEVIKDTKEVVVKAEHGAAAVVGGAVKATGEVGTAAVETVHNAVTKPTNSEKPLVKEPEMSAIKN